MPRPKTNPVSEPGPDGMNEDQLIEQLVATADEGLARAVYVQANEVFITNLVNALSAFNVRWHRSYPVINFSMVSRPVMKAILRHDRVELVCAYNSR